MLANPKAPDIRDQFDRLADLGVEVKAQVVLCPEVNNGPVLEQTVEELGQRAGRPVDSVAIVPVGLTRYSRAPSLRAARPEEARAIVRRAREWQRQFRTWLGRDFVYLSDELYLLARQRFPPAWRYDGYRQLQNGVGLTRLLLEQWRRSRSDLPAEVGPPRRVLWVCGRAARAALESMAAEASAVDGLRVDVIDVANEFFGGGVTVSGLLAGRDIAATLATRAADLAVLPRSAFGFEGRQTLDGWTPERLQAEATIQLALAGAADELLALTLGREDPTDYG
jgi:putative radical SAM enzyme (TIGR03279 family)